MLEPFTTATANRSTVLPCSALRSSVSPACGVHTLCSLRGLNLCGRGQFAIVLLAHLGFKRMVSCSFRDKRMRLKTRAYGIYFVWMTSCLLYSSAKMKVLSIIYHSTTTNCMHILLSNSHVGYTNAACSFSAHFI